MTQRTLTNSSSCRPTFLQQLCLFTSRCCSVLSWLQATGWQQLPQPQRLLTNLLRQTSPLPRRHSWRGFKRHWQLQLVICWPPQLQEKPMGTSGGKDPGLRRRTRLKSQAVRSAPKGTQPWISPMHRGTFNPQIAFTKKHWYI